MPKLLSIRKPEPVDRAKTLSVTVKRDFRIIGESGLTMLKCTHLIEQLGDFSGRITISNGAISVDGRSIIDMLQLAAIAGTVLTIELVGQDAGQVMGKIAPILEQVR